MKKNISLSSNSSQKPQESLPKSSPTFTHVTSRSLKPKDQSARLLTPVKVLTEAQMEEYFTEVNMRFRQTHPDFCEFKKFADNLYYDVVEDYQIDDDKYLIPKHLIYIKPFEDNYEYSKQLYAYLQSILEDKSLGEPNRSQIIFKSKDSLDWKNLCRFEMTYYSSKKQVKRIILLNDEPAGTIVIFGKFAFRFSKMFNDKTANKAIMEDDNPGSVEKLKSVASHNSILETPSKTNSLQNMDFFDDDIPNFSELSKALAAEKERSRLIDAKLEASKHEYLMLHNQELAALRQANDDKQATLDKFHAAIETLKLAKQPQQLLASDLEIKKSSSDFLLRPKS